MKYKLRSYSIETNEGWPPVRIEEWEGDTPEEVVQRALTLYGEHGGWYWLQMMKPHDFDIDRLKELASVPLPLDEWWGSPMEFKVDRITWYKGNGCLIGWVPFVPELAHREIGSHCPYCNLEVTKFTPICADSLPRYPGFGY